MPKLRHFTVSQSLSRVKRFQKRLETVSSNHPTVSSSYTPNLALQSDFSTPQPFFFRIPIASSFLVIPHPLPPKSARSRVTSSVSESSRRRHADISTSQPSLRTAGRLFNRSAKFHRDWEEVAKYREPYRRRPPRPAPARGPIRPSLRSSSPFSPQNPLNPSLPGG